MSRKIFVVLALMLVVFCMTTAFATDYSDEYGYDYEYSDGFFVYNDEEGEQGELGDESVPITLLGGLAVLSATGAIIVHKKRQSIR